jgi:hypothetical protein
MKKLLLSIAFASVALVALDANGWWRRNGCNSCARTCAPVCEPVCEKQCKPACKSYKVIDEMTCDVPECERFVRVTEPAICHRYCRWSCPEGTTLSGTNVEEEVNVTNQYGQTSKLYHTY